MRHKSDGYKGYEAGKKVTKQLQWVRDIHEGYETGTRGMR